MIPAVSTSSAYCNECGSWQRDGHPCAAAEHARTARLLVAAMLGEVVEEARQLERYFDREERRAVIVELAQRRKGGR